MTVVNVHEAKTHLSRLLERVEEGEQITIARAGKPVAVLSRYEPSSAGRRTPGGDRGRIRMSDDFDAPMPGFDGWDPHADDPLADP